MFSRRVAIYGVSQRDVDYYLGVSVSDLYLQELVTCCLPHVDLTKAVPTKACVASNIENKIHSYNVSAPFFLLLMTELFQVDYIAHKT